MKIYAINITVYISLLYGMLLLMDFAIILMNMKLHFKML